MDKFACIVELKEKMKQENIDGHGQGDDCAEEAEDLANQQRTRQQLGYTKKLPKLIGLFHAENVVFNFEFVGVFGVIFA